MLEGAKSMGAGAATIALAGAAIGIGNVFSSLIHSVARNPSLAKQLFGYAILGFALTEAIALFALMMAFLIFERRIRENGVDRTKPSDVAESVGSNPARDNGSRRKGADFATDYSTLREKDFMYQSGAI
ncbi:ATPase complex subunit 9 [Dionaea muscipula]